MAIAIDSSSPIRWTGIDNTATGDSSASFTAPANSLLVVCVSYDTGPSPGSIVIDVSDSGGLTWTRRVERTGAETTVGGASAIWTAPQVTSAARTVKLVYNPTGQASSAVGSARKSAKLYVVTGADISGTPVDTVSGSNEGGSGSNNLTTTSITPGADGLLFACDTDWNTLGAFESSSDLTQDTANYAGEISVCSGYKTASSGVGVTANLNAAGSGTPQHKWTQIIVRAAAAASASSLLIPAPSFQPFLIR